MWELFSKIQIGWVIREIAHPLSSIQPHAHRQFAQFIRHRKSVAAHYYKSKYKQPRASEGSRVLCVDASLRASQGRLRESVDSVNSSDPTDYCQDLDLSQSIEELHRWIESLDLSVHYPKLPDAGNLAALVPRNSTLQKLLSLGADLSKMEGQPGIANLLVKLDFEREIAPKLWVFSDFGFPLETIARILTAFPRMLHLSTDELRARLQYFSERGFSQNTVISMLLQKPAILALTCTQIDANLGQIQSLFKLQTDDVRAIAIDAPECVIRPTIHIKNVFVLLTKMMQYPLTTARDMVIACPRLLLSSHGVLSKNFFHLHWRLDLSPGEVIAFSPRALTSAPRLLSERTLFLARIGRFQPLGHKPLYTHLDQIVEGTDAEFCRNFGHCSEEKYNDFLRTQ